MRKLSDEITNVIHLVFLNVVSKSLFDFNTEINRQIKVFLNVVQKIKSLLILSIP